ncbi:hypothetical protein PEPS_27680 (plasmid) [Persicobacter psychrovividus]|uniref:Alpha-1,2-mannosidase n=2 Tax=Persicobacter psychrovividus TaxID=387638 RepID=A0ABM7VHN8_9BACT|nr:hypothetical protein PEPS_27680 [Persicobacter psychrovividus]
MKKTFYIALLALCSCIQQPKQTPKTASLTQYVDPMIGTSGNGHTHPSAMVPFGMVSLGPSNFNNGWDWCSGYNYADSSIVGFAHTHLSGTGIGDMGDILIMANTGEVKVVKGSVENPDTGYRSRFTHDREEAKAGYYAVDLLDYHIKAEMTASERVGFHKYTFQQHDNAHLIMDLREGIGWDLAKDCEIKVIDDHTIVGKRNSTGWSSDQQLYFYAQTNQPITDFQLYKDTKPVDGQDLQSNFVKGVFFFDTEKNPTVELKVALSPVSIAQAEKNMEAEIPAWNFKQVVAQANQKWQKELEKIEVSTLDDKSLRTFYTAVYHSLSAPNLYNDHDKTYRGTDRKVHQADFNNYSTFSLWDTYRANHPLFTITQTDKVADMVNSFLAQYKESGLLPVWSLAGNETNTMVGYHAVPVIADAYLKGIRGFDAELALEAMKTTANADREGIPYLTKIQYIPADKVGESVAKALEYAIDDWGIAQMAKALGHQEDFDYYSKRAKLYTEYFDKETGFFRGKKTDGSWTTPFNPIASSHRDDDYCEGNAWQYLWLVPQDVEGLIDLLGGDEAFVNKLNTLFTMSSDLGENASPDISGLIGQYAQGNEPSHHTAYLFNYAGQAWKTQERIREICSTMFNDGPAGLPGNEDCGQMSAWYIFSSMGMYPVNPMNGMYVFGSPSVNSATIQLQNGKSFSIATENQSAKNIYIQSVSLNGQDYSKSYILHKDIMKGGKLTFTMGDKPNKQFGTPKADRPSSKFHEELS